MTIPPFGSLSRSDYEALGFMVGLEVHQQLLTERKLFCRCPAGRYSKEYDAEILRHMRPTLSELGEYDGTALMEFKTRKEIIYRLRRETVCTYEMDDTPPFGVDDEALDHALEIAVLLGCNIVSEAHITRKQYLDGSIPTGFQRTTILGTDGHIIVNGNRVGVRQLALEEDSCREVSDIGHRRVYLTDRLSMPLIETVTEPELYTPWDAAAANQVIRLLNRSSGKVRRGHGAGREDVNVSIRGGTRIEIKGVPRIPLIPALVHYEAFRQKSLLDLRDALLARGISKDSFTPTDKDVTNVVGRTEYAGLRDIIDNGGCVRAVLLPGFGELLSTPTQPGRPFAAEISDRVRVIACVDQLPNLLYRHMLDPAIDPSIWPALARAMRAGDNDALVLVWGTERDARTAAREVELRCIEALEGVPSETRQVLGDGTAGITGFERILPGPDRMYPDTDLPPVTIADERVEAATSRADAPPWILRERYCELGIPESLQTPLMVAPWRPLFADALEAHPALSPVAVAELITARLTSLRRRAGGTLGALDQSRLVPVFRGLADGLAQREILDDLLDGLAASADTTLDTFLTENGYAPVELDEATAVVREVVDALEGEGPSGGPPRWRFVMGAAMNRLKGRIEGRRVAAILETVAPALRVAPHTLEKAPTDL